MRVWIDLSNSPHALLFEPVARRLAELGHSVELTARDNAQTVALARERWPTVEVIGGESPGGRAAKAVAVGRRVLALRRWARGRRLDLAVSHNSYAQIVAARLCGLPVLTAMDFEHQPANHLAFRLAGAILVPEALPQESIAAKGARQSKVRRYPGLKEELYLGDFEPDDAILDQVGVARDRATALVVVRTPPSRALYHQFDNPLFTRLLAALGNQPAAQIVALPRHSEQIAALEALRLPNLVVPRFAVDSRSLMYAADLVIGAGGTMTREAALMGVPTLSAYAGAPPTVDLVLEADGRLTRLTSAEQVEGVRRRSREPHPVAVLRERSALVLGAFVETICEFGHSRSRGDVADAPLNSPKQG